MCEMCVFYVHVFAYILFFGIKMKETAHFTVNKQTHEHKNMTQNLFYVFQLVPFSLTQFNAGQL